MAILPQIAWLAEVDGSVSHFNSRWYEYTGLTPVESQGWGLLRAVHPEDRIFFADENYWAHSVECRIQGADGIYRWFSVQRMPVKGVGGEILEWVGTLTLKEPVAQSSEEYWTQGTGLEESQNSSEQIRDTPEARNFSGSLFNLSTASPLLMWASKDVSAQPPFEISSHSLVPTASSDRQRGKLPIQEQAVGHSLNSALQPQGTLDAKLSRAIVWEADATTPEFTFVSPSAENILGYPVEQWLDQPDFWVNLIHPEDRQWTVALCRKRMVQGRDYELEYRCLAADKRVVWLRDRAFVVRDDQGQAYKRRGLMVDITPAKQAEAELQTSIHFWSAIAQLTQQVLSRIPISTLMDEAASLVAQTLGIEYCQVWEWLPDDKMLKLQAGVGWRNELVGNLAIEVNPHTQVGYTLQSGQPAVVEDWSSETHFEHFPLLDEHHIASGMSVTMAGKSNPDNSN
ncbi:MAG TPA: PAS domain-containing protein, partial [Coleofasciculaceae cyanobacterium]